jgi:hypothetical protein
VTKKPTAIKLLVEVGTDHTIRLPDDVPVGPAEVTVVTRVAAAAPPPDALGLFKDTPELVDQAMAHVVEMRNRSRMRPAR